MLDSCVKLLMMRELGMCIECSDVTGDVLTVEKMYCSKKRRYSADDSKTDAPGDSNNSK